MIELKQEDYPHTFSVHAPSLEIGKRFLTYLSFIGYLPQLSRETGCSPNPEDWGPATKYYCNKHWELYKHILEFNKLYND